MAAIATIFLNYSHMITVYAKQNMLYPTPYFDYFHSIVIIFFLVAGFFCFFLFGCWALPEQKIKLDLLFKF